MDYTTPLIFQESQDYLVVFKPAGIPTVPLEAASSHGGTLLELIGKDFPEITDIQGVRPWEGGVVHRLDTATSGLVLIARTQLAFAHLQTIQADGMFQKKYLAGSFGGAAMAGFPKPAPFQKGDRLPVLISSRFRAYGPGRKAVRPIDEQSSRLLKVKGGTKLYQTLVHEAGSNIHAENLFLCELTEGFRHQVRCHLAWCGFPLVGDNLYGGAEAAEMHLFAFSLRFPDVKSREMVEFQTPWRPRWAESAAENQAT